MITKYKIFETVHQYKPTSSVGVGDYVTGIDTALDDIDMPTNDKTKLIEYIKNNIGIVIKLDSIDGEGFYPVKVEYVVNDIEILKIFRSILNEKFINGNKVEFEYNENEVSYWCDNKDELDLIIKANKYNL